MEAVVTALRPRAAIQPPKHMLLRPGDVAYWNSILTGRARDEWRACDIMLPVQLDRIQADLAAETERLAVEGMVTDSAKADGNPITTPGRRSATCWRSGKWPYCGRCAWAASPPDGKAHSCRVGVWSGTRMRCGRCSNGTAPAACWHTERRG